MNEPDQPRDVDKVSEDEADSEEEYAPTPFDNPFFLPVLLTGFALWFIYDGWFNPDMEWIKFNRIGGAISSVLAIWFTVRAIRERRAASVSNGNDQGS